MTDAVPGMRPGAVRKDTAGTRKGPELWALMCEVCLNEFQQNLAGLCPCVSVFLSVYAFEFGFSPSASLSLSLWRHLLNAFNSFRKAHSKG